MGVEKRYCELYTNGEEVCFRDGFWYSEKGIIIKWAILGGIFFFFMAWFLGGYLHAKRRLRKGQPLLAYHRWLVSYNERRRYGQTPQNHFTFYATNPYAPQRRPDGTFPEPPPMYSHDAPPSYYPPPQAAKMGPNQQGVEMPEYGGPTSNGAYPPASYPMAPQQTGVVGSNGVADVENQHQSPPLPERPQNAKTSISNFVSRFRR